MTKTLRELSRAEFAVQDKNKNPDHEDIQTGCLQRIADALVRLAAAVEQIEARTERLENEWARPSTTITMGGSDAKP